MRDEWYSDKRDLVKWGVLLRLAELHDASAILQVAYYRPTPWDRKAIEIDGREYPVPREAVNHFRNIKNIESLKSTAQVIVLDNTFDDRDHYLQGVLIAIRELPKPAIVFLDPDTGLEPTKPDLKHVLEGELRDIWNALRPGDLLAFYQHQFRHRHWVRRKQAQFEEAIGLEPGGSKLAQGKGIASDVAFFFSQRLDSFETAQVGR